MPFGKHKGRLMQDVPADYLCWLWNEGLKHKTRTSDVANYIERNISALSEEYPDGIWGNVPIRKTQEPEPETDIQEPEVPF